MFVIDHFPVYIDSFLCTGCGDCANICPCDAIVPDVEPYYPPEPNPESIFDVDWFFYYSEPYYWGQDYYGRCNELVRDIYLENGLYFDPRTIRNIQDDPHFVQVYNPVDGDIVLWPYDPDLQSGHMGIYISGNWQCLFSACSEDAGYTKYTSYNPFIEKYGCQPIFLRYRNPD